MNIKPWQERCGPRPTSSAECSAKQAEIDDLRAELQRLEEQKPVAWGIEATEQIFFGGADAKPFAKAWAPLYLEAGANHGN